MQANTTHTTIFRLSPHFGSPSFDPILTINPAISSGRTTTVEPEQGGATAGMPYSMTIQVRDEFGAKRSVAGDTFSITVSTLNPKP